MFRLQKGGCGGFTTELFSASATGCQRQGDGPGSIPLVLEVKSQGQLEVKLDGPALMRPAQGVVQAHVNLEKTDGSA